MILGGLDSVCSLNGGREATVGFVEGDGPDFAGVDVGHAANDFFFPGGCDGWIVRFVEAFDEGPSKVCALRNR